MQALPQILGRVMGGVGSQHAHAPLAVRTWSWVPIQMMFVRMTLGIVLPADGVDACEQACC